MIFELAEMNGSKIEKIAGTVGFCVDVELCVGVDVGATIGATLCILLSNFLVDGPTDPTVSSPLAFWKALTAATVACP